jgi:hypothetical protein
VKIPIYLNLKVGTVIRNAAGNWVPRKLTHLFFAGPHPTGPNLTYAAHPDFNTENASQRTAHQIQLLSDDPAVNLETGYVCFQREGADPGVVLCRGNGETAECRGVVTPEGRVEANPAAPLKPLEGHACGESCPAFAAGTCKLFGVLRFRSPGRTPIGKVDQIRTTSKNSIQELLGSMEAIKSETGGVLSGIPLRIHIEHRKGGRGVNDFQVFSIEAEATSPAELLEQAAQAREHRQRVETLRNEAGVTDPTLEERLKATRSIGYETGDEARAIQQEFAPAALEDPDPKSGIPTHAEDPLAQEAVSALMGGLTPGQAPEPASPVRVAPEANSPGLAVPPSATPADGPASFLDRTILEHLGYQDAWNPGLLASEADALIKRISAESGRSIVPGA